MIRTQAGFILPAFVFLRKKLLFTIPLRRVLAGYRQLMGTLVHDTVFLAY